MEFNRTYWQAREGTKLNKFQKVNETTSTVELVNAPDSITVEGTEVTINRLNNMEAGIDGAVAGVNEIQGVVDFTTALNTFSGLSQTGRGWQGMTTLGSDVYACVNGGDIYKQTNGTGDFVALGQESRNWQGMTTLGSDVYACVSYGDIYKQTNGIGDFISLGQTLRYWRSMTTLGSDVYACVSGGDIYKQTNGIGDFIALGQTSRNWYGMTTLGSDIYACVTEGDIYKQTNGIGDFVALGQESRGWRGMTTLGSDVYACVYGGDIYKQTNGIGDFVALGQESRNWYGMTTLGDVLYACKVNGDIYTATILTGNTFRATSSFTLPAMPDGARKRILNTHATNAITVTANYSTTIEGQATMTLSAGHEVELELIGTDWRKVVLSQSATPEAGKAMVWPNSSIKVWRSDNDGSGSGLDADLLDGVDSGQFMRNNGNVLTSGSVLDAFTRSGVFTAISSTTDQPTTNSTYLYFVNYYDTNSAVVLAISTTAGKGLFFLRTHNLEGWSPSWIEIWNSANNGSGSGLETDKIPFATKTGTSTGAKGQASFDASYLYLCTSTNVWKRVALTSF